MTEQFKILTARAHVRLRIGMYLGSTAKTEVERFVKGQWKTAKYVPALFKCFNEILDNSIDEAIRTNFKHATRIHVTTTMNKLSVEDNGRGIPHDEIHNSVTGEDIPRPVAAWTHVNAGTSFTDDRVTIGANGVGSSAVNFVSSHFIGVTQRDGKKFTVECEDGADKINWHSEKVKGNKTGTSVEFVPDWSLFEVDSLYEDDLIDLIEDRLMNLSVAYPEITFWMDGRQIGVKKFKEYAKMYGDVTIDEESKTLSFLIASSEDGFRTNSYVNGVNTYLGGTYVDIISNGVAEELASMVKRKHKIEVSKSTIKNGLSLILFARNFVDPRFDSQTKERLTSTVGKTKDHYEASGTHDIVWLAKRIMNTPEIIDPIIEAQLAKKLAADKRAATLAQKKLKKIKVAKHIEATGDNAVLHLVEGDSALGPCVEVRDPRKHGFFPLRGKSINSWDMKPADVLKNKEISELVAILGLNIMDKDSWENMNYDKVNIMVDSDVDGVGHIAPLLVALFSKFWPGVIEAGKLAILRSPVLISTKGKETKWFYRFDEANEFKENSKGYYHRYIKGLGSLEPDEYQEIINNPVLDVLELDSGSKDSLEMMFGNSADLRKDFMMM